MYKLTQTLILDELAECQSRLLRAQAMLAGGEATSRDEKAIRTKLGALAQVMQDVRAEVERQPTRELD